MPTQIVMPQMGESIVEGTIVRWLKKVGDHVDRDEPLFEITTDKVEAEIPSPAEGTLTEITAGEGQTVSVNTVVGVIQQAGEESAKVEPSQPDAAVPPVQVAPAAAAGRPASVLPQDELRRQKSSPIVRRIAREHSVDIATLDEAGHSRPP